MRKDSHFTNTAGNYVPGKYAEIKKVGWFNQDGLVTGWVFDSHNDREITGLVVSDKQTVCGGYTLQDLFEVWVRHHQEANEKGGAE